MPNDYRKFNANELGFSETLEKRNGYFFSEAIPGKGENANCIQTPRMKCVRMGADHIDLEFPEKHSSFYKAVIQTDGIVKDTYLSESEKWTKKQASEDKVNEDFRSSVVVPTELRGMPVLRVYLPSSELSISNQNGDELTISHLEAGLDTVCILEMKGIRMKKNYVTPYWEVIQMRVYTSKRHRQPVGKYAFLDDLVSVKPASLDRDDGAVEKPMKLHLPEEGVVEEIEPVQKKVRYSDREPELEVPETPRKKYVSPPPSPRKKSARFLSRAVDSDLEYSEEESD